MINPRRLLLFAWLVLLLLPVLPAVAQDAREAAQRRSSPGAEEAFRVLLNLLGNAFDAVREHAASQNGKYEPIVRVSTCREGDGVQIRVADNGPGIPAEIREKIFEPFFTTKPTGSGTGLGLSMSYDIVAQGHGGTLAVESEEGQGAAFVITLPAQAMT